MTVFFESKGAGWAQEHIRPLCMKLTEEPLKAEKIENLNPDCIFLNLESLCKKCNKCAIRAIIEQKGKENKIESK